MALRQFLYFNLAADNPGPNQAAATDSLQLGGLTMSGAIAMGANKITGLASGASAGDALAYGQASASLAGLTMTGLLDMGANNITSSHVPAAANDLCNKTYVDAVATGMSPKASCNACSTSNIATLSGLTTTVDSVLLGTDGMRVLLTAQTTQSQNGIWLVHSGAWTRPTDFNTGASAAGSFTFIEAPPSGSNTWGGTGWVCTAAPGSDIIGTNNLPFTQFSSTGEIVAGNGLTKPAANTLAIALQANSGLQFTGSNLDTLLNASGGLQKGASGLSILVQANTGLTTSASGLAGVANAAQGMVVGASGFGINLAASAGGLQFTSNALALLLEASNPTLQINGSNQVGVKYDATQGLGTGAAGLKVVPDGSTITFNGSGQLQVSKAPTDEINYNVDSAVSAGQPVYLTATGNRIAASDGTDAKAKVIGVTRTAQAVVGSPAAVVFQGPCAGILTGATPGATYYLAAAGGLTTSPPAGGNHLVSVGYAINATDLFVMINRYGKV